MRKAPLFLPQLLCQKHLLLLIFLLLTIYSTLPSPVLAIANASSVDPWGLGSMILSIPSIIDKFFLVYSKIPVPFPPGVTPPISSRIFSSEDFYKTQENKKTGFLAEHNKDEDSSSTNNPNFQIYSSSSPQEVPIFSKDINRRVQENLITSFSSSFIDKSTTSSANEIKAGEMTEMADNRVLIGNAAGTAGIKESVSSSNDYTLDETLPSLSTLSSSPLFSSTSELAAASEYKVREWVKANLINIFAFCLDPNSSNFAQQLLLEVVCHMAKHEGISLLSLSSRRVGEGIANGKEQLGNPISLGNNYHLRSRNAALVNPPTREVEGAKTVAAADANKSIYDFIRELEGSF